MQGKSGSRFPWSKTLALYLWGKIVDCQYGYRAQYAYPKRFYSNSYEYNYAYNDSTFALREFDVPVEPMPETVTQPEFVYEP